MKKLFSIAAVAATIVLASCGGGTTKQVVASSTTQNNGLGVEIAKSPAQLYAEDPNATTLRAYASYNALPSMPVVSLAATQARGELAQSIAALVTAANTLYAEQYGKESLSKSELDALMSANNSAKNKIEVIAKELVQYTPVKINNKYTQENRTITAHVCVELHPQNILQAIQNDKSYQEAVNKNEQIYIDFKSEEYSKSLEKSFEDLKNAKQNK